MKYTNEETMKEENGRNVLKTNLTPAVNGRGFLYLK